MKKYFEITKDTRRAHEFFENLLAYTIGPKELKHMIENHLDSFNLVDVREYEKYVEGHIPYAVHVPCDQIDEQMVKFHKDKINIIYCCSPVCRAAKKACAILSKEGYPVMELNGGFKAWKKFDFEIIEDDVTDYPG